MNKNPFRKSVYGKNASRKKSIVAFLLAAALLISSVGIVSASQSWDFNDDNIMYKGEHVENGTVAIVAGESNIWRSEHAAQVGEGVAFDAGPWNGVLKCDVPSANKKFTVEIGIWDGSSFSSKGISIEYVFVIGQGGFCAFSLTASQFTVPKDQWLAARVNNTGSEDFVLITEDGCSHITYPSNEPDYPVPELPTIILMSMGLLALAGYVVYSRSRRRKER